MDYHFAQALWLPVWVVNTKHCGIVTFDNAECSSQASAVFKQPSIDLLWPAAMLDCIVCRERRACGRWPTMLDSQP